MTRAPLAQQKKLLDLQRQDSETMRITHEQRNDPVHDVAAKADAKVAGLRDREIAARTTMEDAARSIKKIEADVAQVQTRKDRDQARLDAGEVPAKQLAALQEDLAHVSRRISVLEDEQLGAMEKLDDATAAHQQVADDLAAATQRAEDAHADVRAAQAKHDDLLATIATKRAAITTDIPADLLAVYDNARSQHAGLAVAPLQGRRCEGCRMTLSEGDLIELREAAADELTNCAECDRILVRLDPPG